jgi:hypothetical protein
MRNAIFAGTLFIVTTMSLTSNKLTGVVEAEYTAPKRSRKDSLRALLNAQKYVESRGDSMAYNARENAAGVLQIRPIFLSELNRQLKLNGRDYQYTLQDRFSEKKSEKIWYDYVDLMHKNHKFERIARCWNGGPRGHKKQSTIVYWNRVENKLNQYAK